MPPGQRQRRTAVTAYDDGIVNGTNHAVYKGLALGEVNGASFLYATDLHNNKIDVFDTHFTKPAAYAGKFIDPNLPSGFVPFGIVALNTQLYVTYAMQAAASMTKSRVPAWATLTYSTSTVISSAALHRPARSMPLGNRTCTGRVSAR